MFKKRHIYRGWIIDHDNLGRPYIYNMASPYSEDADHEIVPGWLSLMEITNYIDDLIEKEEILKEYYKAIENENDPIKG